MISLDPSYIFTLVPSLASAPGPLLIFGFERAWYAHGQVAVWCEYSSSETDDRIDN